MRAKCSESPPTGRGQGRHQATRCMCWRAGAQRRHWSPQPQVREDPLDHVHFEDGGDDLELAAAMRAVLEVDLVHALEQPGPGETPYSDPSPAATYGRYAKLFITAIMRRPSLWQVP